MKEACGSRAERGELWKEERKHQALGVEGERWGLEVLQRCWPVQCLIADVWLDGSVWVPGPLSAPLPPLSCLSGCAAAQDLVEKKQALAVKTQGEPFPLGCSASSLVREWKQSLRAGSLALGWFSQASGE